MRALLAGCFLWVSCSSPPAPCDCTKLKATEPTSCVAAVTSTSIPLPQDPQTLLLEKQALLAALQKEIDELKANLAPKEEAPAKTASAKKEKPEKKEVAATPKPKEEPKPAEEPKKGPALKLVPR